MAKMSKAPKKGGKRMADGGMADKDSREKMMAKMPKQTMPGRRMGQQDEMPGRRMGQQAQMPGRRMGQRPVVRPPQTAGDGAPATGGSVAARPLSPFTPGANIAAKPMPMPAPGQPRNFGLPQGNAPAPMPLVRGGELPEAQLTSVTEPIARSRVQPQIGQGFAAAQMKPAMMRKGGVVKSKGKTYAKGGMVKGSGCAKRGVKKAKYS